MIQKIVSWAKLKKRLKDDRRCGRSVVFTNGCFDLLHVGHLKVFEWCRRHGEVLVLGLNSDRSVRRLKGPKRPLVRQAERARLLAGLEPITYVTIFDQDTPESLIRLVRPDVLVKGGDWTGDKIVGRTIAKKVVRVPLVKGRSTSQLIQTIVKRYGG